MSLTLFLLSLKQKIFRHYFFVISVCPSPNPPLPFSAYFFISFFQDAFLLLFFFCWPLRKAFVWDSPPRAYRASAVRGLHLISSNYRTPPPSMASLSRGERHSEKTKNERETRGGWNKRKVLAGAVLRKQVTKSKERERGGEDQNHSQFDESDIIVPASRHCHAMAGGKWWQDITVNTWILISKSLWRLAILSSQWWIHSKKFPKERRESKDQFWLDDLFLCSGLNSWFITSCRQRSDRTHLQNYILSKLDVGHVGTEHCCSST